MPQTIELRVPDIGDHRDVSIIEILVQPGDAVALEQALVTVESDKAAMEIPASQAGRVKQLLVTLGDKVSMGSPIALVEVGVQAMADTAPPDGSTTAKPDATTQAPAAVSSPDAPVQWPRQQAAPAAAVPPPGLAEPTPHAVPHASPSVRQFARELDVRLDGIVGTGAMGRITREDVLAFVKQAVAHAQLAPASAQHDGPTSGSTPLSGLLAWPQVDFSKFGPVERRELSKIKKASGANLHRNWVLIPHVTNHEEADITELEAFRVALNQAAAPADPKVTLLAFLIKAAAVALKTFPDVNASLDGDHLVLKRYVNIGFAADTPNGLLVPVIREADHKGIRQISQEVAALARKARDGRLTPGDMSGGCFSISSLGGIGGTGFTPIINAPEVAILGVCRSVTKPVWDGERFVPRLMLPMSLAWDHRVIDGATAARFNALLASLLSDFRRVSL